MRGRNDHGERQRCLVCRPSPSALIMCIAYLLLPLRTGSATAQCLTRLTLGSCHKAEAEDDTQVLS